MISIYLKTGYDPLLFDRSMDNQELLRFQFGLSANGNGENGDWLRNRLYPRLVKDTITCGACPRFHAAQMEMIVKSEK